MEKVFAAIFIAVLALTGCIFNPSGIAAGDSWFTDGEVCEQSPCGQDDSGPDGDMCMEDDGGMCYDIGPDPDTLPPDGPKPEGPKPDILPPDGPQPDTVDPCEGSNGKTCSGNGACVGGVCGCIPGYDPTTKCGSCLPTHCGYATGVCQPLPAITTTNPTLVCGAAGCQTNTVHEVPFTHANATRLKAEVPTHINLITGNVGTFGPTSGGPFSNPPYTVTLATGTKLFYKLADKVLSPSPQPYADIKLTVDVPTKPSCTPATVTINVPYK